jgi:hypothetical protein
MKEYLTNMFASPAFYKGLVWLAMAAGWQLDPDQQNSIIGLGLSAQAIIHAFQTHNDSKP